MRTKFLITNLLISLNICFAQEFKVNYFHGSNDVNSIAIIGDSVWVGGYLGLTRINRLNYNDKEFIVNPFINHQKYCFSIVTQEDNAGNLFVHDYKNINKFEQSSLELLDSGSYFSDFFIDENNTKWILRGNNVIKIESNGKKTIYNNNNSTLPNYNYTRIFAKNNEIFLGSDNGLVKFNGKSSQLFNSGNKILPFNSISSIAVDNRNNIWLSCDTSGYVGQHYFHNSKLVKVSGINSTFYNPNNSSSIGISKIVPQEDTIYLCTTNDGLIKFNGSTFSTIDKEQNHLLSNYISDIAFDGNRIWIGTDLGISIFSGDTTINVEIANLPISDEYHGPIIEDLTGNIWVGTYGGPYGKLIKYDGHVWRTIIQGTSLGDQISIYSLAVDKNNTVWATSYSFDSKVFKISKDGITTYDQKNSPIPQFPKDIVIDKDNNKWITSDWEILKFSDSTWTVYTSDDFAYLTLPKSIAADKKGNVWIGVNQNGMVKFDGKKWVHYDDIFFGNEYSEVNKIIVDNNDNLWINYTHGTLDPKICMFDGNSLTWYDQNINLPKIGPFSGLLAVEKNGDLWVDYEIDSFEHGIAKYDWKEWKYYNTANSRLISNQVHSFIIDHNDNKWISAECYLAKFNEDSIYYPNSYQSKKRNDVYSIFPNPCDNSVFLSPLNPINYGIQLNLFDLRGFLLKSYNSNSKDNIELNLTNYNSGLYLIQIIGKDFIETHKVLKK